MAVLLLLSQATAKHPNTHTHRNAHGYGQDKQEVCSPTLMRTLYHVKDLKDLNLIHSPQLHINAFKLDLAAKAKGLASHSTHADQTERTQSEMKRWGGDGQDAINNNSQIHS